MEFLGFLAKGVRNASKFPSSEGVRLAVLWQGWVCRHAQQKNNMVWCASRNKFGTGSSPPLQAFHFPTRNTPNAVKHADYQVYVIFTFCNILIASVLIGSLQEGFTVYPG